MDAAGWALPGAPDTPLSRTALPAPSAPIVAFRTAVDALLSHVDPVDTTPLAGLAVDIAELHRLQNRVSGFFAAQVASFDARGGGQVVAGARSTGTWLSATTRMTERDARGVVWVGRRCFGGAGRRPMAARTAAALLEGRISLGHAREVAHATADLPAVLHSDVEAGLLTAAGILDPHRLRKVSADLRHQLAPELIPGDDATTRAARELWWTTTFNGMVTGGFTLPPDAQPLLITALEPLAATTGEDDDRTLTQRRADGFLELLSAAAPGTPRGQFAVPEVVVTIPADTLLGLPGAPAARIGTAADTGRGAGAPVSAQTARRLMCDAIVSWMQLDRRQRTLALGRAARSAPAWLRRSIEARDTHCRWPGCTVEPRRCQVHHIIHWCNGGPTDPGNCILLCWFHHDLTHHEGWTITGDADDVLALTPPPPGHQRLARPGQRRPVPSQRRPVPSQGHRLPARL